MPFITWDGEVPNNDYLNPTVKHLILSRPGVRNQVINLLLAEHDEKPYEHYIEGYQTGVSRSVLGGIRLNGSRWHKQRWQCNFLVRTEQKIAFASFLNAQENLAQVTLNDRFEVALGNSAAVWINVDRQYQTVVVPGEWWRLQFELWEV